MDGSIANVSVFNTSLTSTEVSELYAIDKHSSISGHSQFDNCVGSWLMGAGTGDTASTIQDQTTNNNDGTVSGASLVGYNDGTPSGTPVSMFSPEGSTAGKDILGFPLINTDADVLTLNGASYMTVPHADTLKLTTNATWEIWMKQTKLSVQAGILSKGAGTGNMVTFYTWSGNRMYLDIRGPSVNYVSHFTYTDFITANTWHHLTIVFDGSLSGGSRLKAYVDGVIAMSSGISTLPSELPTNTDSLIIGDMAMFTGVFNGQLDELRIYNKSLSAAEVVENFNYGAEAKGKTLIEVE